MSGKYYALHDAHYQEGYITATYLGQTYVGEGYEGESVYEPNTDALGNPDDTVDVRFYARRVEIEKSSGGGYSGGGNPDKTALEQAWGTVAPLDEEDVVQFDEQVAEKSMTALIRSQYGDELDVLPEDAQLQIHEKVNGYDIVVVFERE